MPREPRDPDVNADAAAIARAAWKVKDDEVSVQFRARIPSSLESEMTSQRPWERGSIWADGVRANRALPKIMKAIDALTPLQAPSYIVERDGVTVVWGQWSAKGATTLEAILLLLDHVFPNEC